MKGHAELRALLGSLTDARDEQSLDALQRGFQLLAQAAESRRDAVRARTTGSIEMNEYASVLIGSANADLANGWQLLLIGSHDFFTSKDDV